MLERLENQKRLTANQWKIIATANIGDMLDFFDFFLIGYVLAFILRDWQLTYGQSALILASAGLGAVPGAFFWGWMGDRIGRRTVFMLTALNVACATGILYFTPGPDGWVPGWIFLSFFRFFVGFGNAGLIAVDIPLVQEFVPASKRGWVSGLTTVLLPAGNILGALSGAYLAPTIGWHGLFLVGLAPAALVVMIRSWVPESPHWLMRMGRYAEGARVARLGIAVRPARDRVTAHCAARGRKNVLARTVPLSTQCGRCLLDRVEPDGRRWVADVDHGAVRHGASDHPGRGVVFDDLGGYSRNLGTSRGVLDVGCLRTPLVGFHDWDWRRDNHGAGWVLPRCLHRYRVGFSFCWWWHSAFLAMPAMPSSGRTWPRSGRTGCAGAAWASATASAILARSSDRSHSP